MKTIREIAETVNVSRTSIYNLIKKNGIPTFKREGKTFLDENGENLIIGYYSTEQHETISDIIDETISEAENDTIQGNRKDEIQESKLIEYTKVLFILEDERSKKNKIIEELLQSNKTLSQALVADRMNETAKLMIKGDIYRNGDCTKGPTSIKGLFNWLLRKNK